MEQIYSGPKKRNREFYNIFFLNGCIFMSFDVLLTVLTVTEVSEILDAL